MRSDWPRVKDDAVNLTLRELPDSREKGSLSLSGLQLAFGFARVPDNVSSNPLQLLRVTRARPRLCHELSPLSSEANPQKSFLNKTQTYTVLCCSYRSTYRMSNTLHTMGNNPELGLDIFQASGGFISRPFLLYNSFLMKRIINASAF